MITFQESTILIACGAAKTDTPRRAFEFYTGELFRTMLEVASHLSPNILILSAGYGLVSPQDILAPYDIKMTPIRAQYFITKGIGKISGKGYSLLPALYLASCEGDITRLLSPHLAIGEQMQQARLLIESGSKPLVDFNSLPTGKTLELIETGKLKQENRKGPKLNICSFIGDLFLAKALSIKEACSLCEEKFGPSLGISYVPTVRRQLSQQALKRGLVIITTDIAGTREKRFTYGEKQP